MANDFKNAVAAGVTTIQTIYTAPASKTTMMLEIDIANTTLNQVTADVKVNDVSLVTEVFLVKAAPVPTGSTLTLGKKVVLETADEVKVECTAACDVTISLLEDI